MIEWILFYFGFNIVLALLLWFFALPKDVSPVGYFLAMFFLALPIIVLVLILAIILVLTGATYNFGNIVQSKLSGIFK